MLLTYTPCGSWSTLDTILLWECRQHNMVIKDMTITAVTLYNQINLQEMNLHYELCRMSSQST